MAFKRSGVRFPSPPPGSIISMARRNPRARNGSPEPYRSLAGIAQLVEHNLAKVGVAGSSPVSRFFFGTRKSDILRQYASDFARNSRESTLTRARSVRSLFPCTTQHGMFPLHCAVIPAVARAVSSVG